jgi:hypothetical protein
LLRPHIIAPRPSWWRKPYQPWQRARAVALTRAAAAGPLPRRPI